MVLDNDGLAWYLVRGLLDVAGRCLAVLDNDELAMADQRLLVVAGLCYRRR